MYEYWKRQQQRIDNMQRYLKSTFSGAVLAGIVYGSCVSVAIMSPLSFQSASASEILVWGRVPGCDVFLDVYGDIEAGKSGGHQTNNMGTVIVSQWIGGFMTDYRAQALHLAQDGMR
jgi:hypothetical protein